MTCMGLSSRRHPRDEDPSRKCFETRLIFADSASKWPPSLSMQISSAGRCAHPSRPVQLRRRPGPFIFAEASPFAAFVSSQKASQ